VPYERLNSQDATLLCAEDPTAPLQIGALCLFEAGALVDEDGRLKLSDLRDHVESHLGGVPRFRQKLRPVPFDQGRPVWVDDVAFDIAHHVRAAALPRPGGRAELRAFLATLLEVPLDRSRPLWELWFVEGVEGDRIAVIPKVNHVMADGMAVLEFALSVLAAEPSPAGKAPRPWLPAPSPAPVRLLVEAVADRVRCQIGVGLRGVGALGHPVRLVGTARTLLTAVTSTVALAPKLAITRPVGPHRDFAWVALPLDELREVERTQGATLNDVVLAIVGSALDHYLGDGTKGADSRPRVLVPVSTHGRPGEVQNHFSMMVVGLPSSRLDPLSRLRATHADMAARKASGQALVGSLLFSLGELVPSRLLRSAAAVALKRQPFVNLAVTNLPGTDAPAYLLGSRMLELFPFVTVAGNIGLIVGVLSYNGTLGVGLTTDADAVGNLDRLAAGIEYAASELIASGGGRSRSARVHESAEVGR